MKNVLPGIMHAYCEKKFVQVQKRKKITEKSSFNTLEVKFFSFYLSDELLYISLFKKKLTNKLLLNIFSSPFPLPPKSFYCKGRLRQDETKKTTWLLLTDILERIECPSFKINM